MPVDLELKPAYPRLISACIWWRHLCEQWRHCYLLLVVMFWVVWRLSAMAIPALKNDRVMGGLHPGDVLLLMGELRLLWVPALVAAILYALSFVVRPLNTPMAIAGSALCSSACLAVVLLSALLKISLG